jgi:hypothetical protein
MQLSVVGSGRRPSLILGIIPWMLITHHLLLILMPQKMNINPIYNQIRSEKVPEDLLDFK